MREPGIPDHDTQNQSPSDMERLAQPSTFRPGDRVDRAENWQLVRRLGIGGFGEVWLAKHEWRAEQRAVKFCTHAQARHRLLAHEKTVLLRVMRHTGDHPNVVPLLEYSLQADVPWLTYEFVPGGTLTKVIEVFASLEPAERIANTVKLLHPLAVVLSQLHKLDPPIVHRDLKPDNVLMAGDVPRITDFGIGATVVEVLAEAHGLRDGSSAALPSILHAMGTFRYAPPEQLFGSLPNPRDDVFSLGVLAYQMVTGDLKTVPGTDAADVLRELSVPANLAALIVKSVAMDPVRRPADAGEWERTVAELLQPTAEPPRPFTATPEQTHPPTATAEEEFQRGEARYHGQGVPQDYTVAREHYERAANLGHSGAEYSLGGLAYHGHGEPQNYAKARAWYARAAAKNHPDACFALAMLHEFGQGGPRDCTAARTWYEKVALTGDADAQYRLGNLYRHGHGGPPDARQARNWYSKAAASGHPAAAAALARLQE